MDPHQDRAVSDHLLSAGRLALGFQILVSLSGLFLVFWMLTAISMLSSLGAPSNDVRPQDLMKVNLWPMLLGPSLRSVFPSLPPQHDFWNLPAAIHLAMTLLFVGLTRIRSRHRELRPLTAIITKSLILLLGLVPLLAAPLFFLATPLTPADAGWWAGYTLHCSLYHSLAALFPGSAIARLRSLPSTPPTQTRVAA